jgi:site-specific DNA-methyltransferase (adenine-specific)
MGIAAGMSLTVTPASDQTAPSAGGGNKLTFTTGGATIVVGDIELADTYGSVGGVVGGVIGDAGGTNSDVKTGFADDDGTGVSLSTAVGGATITMGHIFNTGANTNSSTESNAAMTAFSASMPIGPATVGFGVADGDAAESSSGLTVKDLNKYLPALKTEIDIHFQEKLKEGLFKVDALVGLKKIPSESIDLIVTEPALDPNSGMSYTSYIKWIEEWVSECKRVLTASGSIYIICPWESSSLYHSVLGKNFIIQSRITAERQIENTELSQWKNKISDIWFATKTNDYIFNQNYIVNGKNINNPKPEEIKDNLWFHLDYEEIVHRVFKASSFKLNWILDPFMNVGAVGVVAKKRGRRFIGFENNQDQILLAMKTINEREK